MFGALARRIFGTANDRVLKPLKKHVEAVNALEPAFEKLSDDELRAKTVEFRSRLENGAELDDLMAEAFATVREAAKRTLGQRHFDVQLLGGMVLHQGRISEMRTGEGKTLVATLPVYLNALSGKGVHVVTVNDYLASRDSEWMGQVYRFLGLTVGVITHGLDDVERQQAYACDVTYGTNNELGFDYLRDNMKFRLEEMVQRPFNYAIVDEVDSILVDEARTPLIISGPTEDNSELYRLVDKLMPSLVPEDFEKDEKVRAVTLTDRGTEHVEEMLQAADLMKGTLYDIGNVSLVHHVNQALRAHKLFTRDVDYIVKNDKVIIIDEFTGRMMEGRRYSEGLHQALEAKEGVTIQNENQTLASITFQNYFRLYPKLAGMTGTAMTEAGEFAEIYNLEVVEIPTNLAVSRKDHDDEVYRTAREKYEAIVTLIEECRGRMQPVLVGTTSIEKSELLADMLKKKKIPHQVLNARYHEQEAYIVAQAGVPGGVTIATNMAGRGTDIQLGGNLEMRTRMELAEITDPAERVRRIDGIKAEIEVNKQKVRESGGLYVVGSERHESRRIDNQLRGRSGRQGDPGSSRFYLSLEDTLMRIFAPDWVSRWMQLFGMKEHEALEDRMITRVIEKSQRKVEAHNFDMRKHLLEFDDTANDQRKVIYEQRKDLMSADDVSEEIVAFRHEVITEMVARCIPERAYADQWDVAALHEEVLRVFNLDLPIAEWAKEEGIADQEIRTRVTDHADRKAAGKVAEYGPDTMRMVEKSLLLQILDQAWKEHLLQLDHLRQGISLRAYAQRDPLNEYKREAFNMFEQMLLDLRERVTSVLSHVQLRFSNEEEAEQALEPQRPTRTQETREDPAFASGGAAAVALSQRSTTVDPNDPATWAATPRNAPCPCGSGKKYKHCHGAV